MAEPVTIAVVVPTVFSFFRGLKRGGRRSSAFDTAKIPIPLTPAALARFRSGDLLNRGDFPSGALRLGAAPAIPSPVPDVFPPPNPQPQPPPPTPPTPPEPEPLPDPPIDDDIGIRAGDIPFVFGFQAPPIVAGELLFLKTVGQILLGAARFAGAGLLGILIPKEMGDATLSDKEINDAVIRVGVLAAGQNQRPLQTVPIPTEKLPKTASKTAEKTDPRPPKISEIDIVQLKALNQPRVISQPKVATQRQTLPKPAPAPTRIPQPVVRVLEKVVTVELLRRMLQPTENPNPVPTGPTIDLAPPTPTPTPPTPTPPTPTPTPPVVPVTPTVIQPVFQPTALAQSARTRTREKDCKEVKRKRKRGKCEEGFYKEIRGKTQYTPWRQLDCLTGQTIKEF